MLSSRQFKMEEAIKVTNPTIIKQMMQINGDGPDKNAIDNEYTYVFESGEMGVKVPDINNVHKVPKLRQKAWQILPAICASMMCLPFGLMLGWPSPTYPLLIPAATSPLPITLDQSAMVAGFLMIGNSLGTPLSTMDYSPRRGLALAAALIAAGWALMWQSRDLYALLGARLLVGLGHGLGMGQLRPYLAHMAAAARVPHATLHALAGVVLAFAVGPFVDFRTFGAVCALISALVLALVLLLPATPRDLVRQGRVAEARRLIRLLEPAAELPEALARLRTNAAHASLLQLLKNAKLRRNFGVFAFLVFFGQFVGAPATIVYAQIMFKAAGCPRPEFSALVYALVFFFANVAAMKSNLPPKATLIFSALAGSVLLVIEVVVLVERVELLWGYSSLVVMILFIVVHTVGLGTVPLRMVDRLFPEEGRRGVVNFFVIFHSMLALIITKTFQVLYGRMGLHVPFCLFLGIGVFALLFIIIFVPKEASYDESK